MSTDPIGITATLAHLRKINAPEQPCILCGAMTTGSVGVAGIVWSNICPPCKSAEDAALWASLQRQTKQDLSGSVASTHATSGQNLSKPRTCAEQTPPALPGRYCEVLVGNSQCGKAATHAYPAMGGGYMALCAEHAKQHPEAWPIKEI